MAASRRGFGSGILWGAALLVLFGAASASGAPDGGASDAGAPDAAPPIDSPTPTSPTPELDVRVAERLRAAFGAVEPLAGVLAEVVGGVVTLRGRVPSAAARDAARGIAEKIEGVLYVQDLVALAPPEDGSSASGERSGADERIASQLRAIFDNAADLKGITVNVSRGVASLGGNAGSDRAIKSAVEVARGLDGVVYVSDQIVLDIADVGDRVGPIMRKVREEGRRAVEMLPIIGLALALFLLFYVIARALRGWSSPYRLVTENPLARGILRQLVFAAVMIIGLLLALEIAGATAMVGAVLGTAGVFGLALGFALQDIVQNYISGVMLSLRQPFGPQDFVQIGDHQGIIIRLTTRETLLMTLDGNHLRIPNSTVFGATLVNYSRNPQRRFDFAVGVGTEVDLVAAQAIALEVLTEMPGVLDDPAPSARIEELGDSTVNLRFYGWVDQTNSDFGKTRSVAIRRLKVALDEAGIEMPSPTYRLDMLPKGGAAQDAPADPPRADVAAEARMDDVSVDRTIAEKVAAERSEDDEDLLSSGST